MLSYIYLVPDPSGSVFHPSNVYPALVRFSLYVPDFLDTVPDEFSVYITTFEVVSLLNLPLFESYVITISAFHCAYNVHVLSFAFIILVSLA